MHQEQLFPPVSAAWAQQNTADLNGQVTDASGAVLPVAVTVTQAGELPLGDELLENYCVKSEPVEHVDQLCALETN